MKHPQDLRLNRRQWLLATTAALTGCGGGGGNFAGAPGTGGTGIGVQGPITGFGSVIVNNTKYDDSLAHVYLDGLQFNSVNGLPFNSTDLRVGMVANISGSLDAGGASGSASRIDVWSLASGDVSAVDIAGSTFSMFSNIGVVGTTFSTDVATSFDGIANLAALSIGASLTVWGEQTSADGRSWRATRVKFLPSSPTTTVSTGLFDASTLMLNDMHISGIDMSSFAGKMVRVEGSFDSLANVLTVTNATPIAAAQQIAATGLIEIEGVVTAFTSATDFYIGTTRVDASTPPVNSAVGLNSMVEATGRMQNGMLIASKVEIKSSNSRALIDITGAITSFTSPSNFLVRGQKCDASSLLTGSLPVGTKVRLTGTSQGHETLLVQSIQIGVP